MKKVLYFLVTLCFFSVYSQNYYHDTQGKLDVAESGQASYTLPIALPPSIQSLQPSISLAYSSGQMGGIAGMGWGVNTISAIRRIGTRFDLDTFIDGVDFDANDKLSFDGQRLLLVGGTYWSDGSTYQTEIFSNFRFELKGSGTNIYFIVTAPDGTRSWYGNYGGMNAVDYSSFYIVRTEDVNGNYMLFTYAKPYNKSLCIDEIKFSANISIVPQHRVKFTYTQLARAENSYIKGAKQERVELLSKVEVYANSSLFRRYQLTHITDTQTGYKRLSKIQEYNGSLEPANPIDFDYYTTTSLSDATTESEKPYTTDLDFADIDVTGDFDGDNRLDFVTENKFYRQLFTGTTTPPVSLPVNDPYLAVTTLKNNRLNQYQSLLYVSYPTTTTAEYPIYDFSNSTNTFGLNYTKSIALNRAVTVQPQFTVWSPAVQLCLQEYTQNPEQYHNGLSIPRYAKGDFDGDGITDLIVSKNTKTIINFSTDTMNPNGCNVTFSDVDWQYFFVDLNPNPATGVSDFVQIPGTDLQGSYRYIGDFNGDGKDEYLLIMSDMQTYKVVEIARTPTAVTTNILGTGTLSEFSPEKLVLLGDYNGDGKTDLMLPDTGGSSSDPGLWHIYYSNPNPAGGAFFVQQSHTITPYWPNSGTYYSTQTHFNNYYALDVNKDGKTDLVRVWRKHYKPDWTINDHNTQWRVYSYINNIGYSGPQFLDDYVSPSIHDSDSPEVPIPVASNYRNNNLNNELVIVRNHYNNVTYVKFTRDFSQDILLKKVTSSAGSLMDELTYKELLPDTPGSNHLGSMSEFYSSGDAVTYPLVEIKRMPGISAVQQQTSTAMGVVKKRDFRYHGFTTNMNGSGAIGFRKIARSDWFETSTAKRNWAVMEYNTAAFRGSKERDYAVLTSSGTNFNFVNGTLPANKINSVVYTYTTALTGGVFKIYPNLITSEDYLTLVKNTKTHTFDTTYGLQTELVSKNYLSGVLQGTNTTTSEYDNNALGIGSNYYIGRLRKITGNSSAYSNVATSEVKYTYNFNRLSRKESRAGNSASTDPNDAIFVVEDYEYFGNGNLKKITTSAPGATPAVTPRTTEYTYDTSERYVKTTKDIEGLITTVNSYHPLYGTVMGVTNPFGQVSSSVCDNWGKKTKVTDYLGNDVDYSYNKSGNLYITTETSDSGAAVSTSSDVLGRIVKKGQLLITGQWTFTDYEYDVFGRSKRESQPYFTSPSQYTTTFYDEYSRIKQVVAYTSLVTNYTYNGLTVTTNDGTKTTTATKNSNGHLISSSDPGGTVTTTFYANGLPKKTVYGTAEIPVEYNGRGNKTKLTDPSAGQQLYKYNIFGELLEETNPRGTTKYYLDAVGKPNSKTVIGTDTNYLVGYQYHPVNKKLILADGYDFMTDMVSTAEYFYDANQRLSFTVEGNQDGYFEKDFSYDGFGRVLTERFIASFGSGTSDKTIKHTYLNGHHWQILDGLTNDMLWQVDEVTARNQLQTIHYGNAVGRESRLYDNYGYIDMTSFRTINGTYASATPFMTLDTNFNAPRGNLTSRVYSVLNSLESFFYDSMDRITTFSNGYGQNEAQSYLANGSISTNSIGTYSYDSTIKPYQLSKIQLATAAIPYYADRVLQQVAYNVSNNPLKIYEEGKERIDFDYNTIGSRGIMYYGSLDTDKTLRPFRKYYSADGSTEAKLNVATNQVEFITYIGGDSYKAPLLFKKTAATSAYYFLHRDYLGSILAITNAAGQVVEKRHFDAWGNVIKLQDGAGANLTAFGVTDCGYTGHEHLQGVKLIQMNGRLYDAKVHRFLSPDNFVLDPSNSQSFNRYGYVLNNPLKYNDPSGEEGISALAVAVIVAVVVAALSYTLTALTADVEFSAGGMVKTCAISAFTAVISYGVGELTGTLFSNGATGFWSGATQGAVKGFTQGITSSTVSTIAHGNGGSLNLKDILKGGAQGAIVGGVTGGIQGGISAQDKGLSFWKGEGQVISYMTVPAEATPAGNQQYGSTSEMRSDYDATIGVRDNMTIAQVEDKIDAAVYLATDSNLCNGCSLNSSGMIEVPSQGGGTPATAGGYTTNSFKGGIFSNVPDSHIVMAPGIKSYDLDIRNMIFKHEFLHAWHVTTGVSEKTFHTYTERATSAYSLAYVKAYGYGDWAAHFRANLIEAGGMKYPTGFSWRNFGKEVPLWIK